MNNADNYESINITLSRENTPIAYQNKLDEIIDKLDKIEKDRSI